MAADPILRPGLLVTRRDQAWFQVGLDPRAILPATAGSRESLTALVDPDLLVDRAEVTAALAARRVDDATGRAGVVAAFTEHGRAATGRLRDRAEATVSLRRLGTDRLLASWSREVTRLLQDGGVGAVTGGDDPTASVALVLSDNEPDRDRLDDLLRTGQPHLLVTLVEGRVRLGPFVVPGRSACLRCVDAHLAERDERRPVVVRQYAATRVEDDGLPRPSDPALMALALAWAARDLTSFVEGDRPATWSSTLLLTAALEVTPHRWSRHPHCGCCWGDLLDVV